ncbi:MAG TPA: paraquat-inducible protein A [Steroidobacteraceae bacterium]|jgi:paraquat-inducible protein A|nr:paraquat-inducible protein A [Steroidobacteraceae bacterium]
MATAENQVENQTRVACPDCGLLQRLPALTGWHFAECRRCARLLAGPAVGRVDAPLALALGALLLMIPATIEPLLSVASHGAERTCWLSSGIVGLWQQGFAPLAVIVGAFCIVFPYVYLASLIAVLAGLRLGVRAHLGPVFRWIMGLRPWMMLEIFLVGCFVAYSRLRLVVGVHVLPGGWCLMAATGALLLALTQLDERTVWEALPLRRASRQSRWHLGRRASDRRDRDRAIACTACELLVTGARPGSICPRCAATLHHRKPYSFRVTAALVAAAFLLYVPANALPVLTLVSFGDEQSNTILSGVLELIHNRLWPLALIVFLASIVVPLLKLCGLTWMLLATVQGSPRTLVARTRFFRFIDTVGSWSNIDVFVASVLVGLLQFGTIAQARAGAGLVAFAAVVVLTMIATRTFDTRLMWDASQRG